MQEQEHQPRARSKTVKECPWSRTDGYPECLTVDCAQYGPTYRIRQSQAARIVAHAREMIKGGFLEPGDRVPLSLRAETYEQLCPRAFSERVAQQLLRDAIGDQLHLEIDENICYLAVLSPTKRPPVDHAAYEVDEEIRRQNEAERAGHEAAYWENA